MFINNLRHIPRRILERYLYLSQRCDFIVKTVQDTLMSPNLPVDPGIGVSALTWNAYVLDCSKSRNKSLNRAGAYPCNFFRRVVCLDVAVVRQL